MLLPYYFPSTGSMFTHYFWLCFFWSLFFWNSSICFLFFTTPTFFEGYRLVILQIVPHTEFILLFLPQCRLTCSRIPCISNILGVRARSLIHLDGNIFGMNISQMILCNNTSHQQAQNIRSSHHW